MINSLAGLLVSQESKLQPVPLHPVSKALPKPLSAGRCMQSLPAGRCAHFDTQRHLEAPASPVTHAGGLCPGSVVNSPKNRVIPA